MTETLIEPEVEVRPFRWTREAYYRLGDDGYFNGQRVELIDGEIVAMSPMTEPHFLGIYLVGEALRAVFGAGFYVRQQGPLHAGVATDLEPDVAVLRVADPRSLAAAPTTAELVVEVSVSSLRHDTIRKPPLYAAAGVPEYWVLDLAHAQLIVFRDPGPGGYATRFVRTATETVAPLAVAGEVRVADMLP